MLKLIALIVSLIFIFSTAGCTGGTQNTAGESQEPSSTSVSVEETGEEKANLTGLFTGQIDSNSIEIKLDSLPEESAFRAFAFSAAAKKQFEQLKLNPGEEVVITYQEREGQQPLIESIKRLAK
jgi:hypothetical protein